MSMTIEQRMDRLDAAEAVKQLHAKYAYAIDNKDAETVLGLFADNFTYEHSRYGKASSDKNALAALLKNKFSAMERTFHSSMLPLYDFVSEDKINCTWYLWGPQLKAPGEGMWLLGVYENSYVKVGGEWKIGALKLTEKIFAPYEGGWAKQMVI